MEINREQLSFQLKNITNDLSYLNKFSKFINEKSNPTTIEQMFNEKFENNEFYQFKNYKDKIINDKIYIKDYSNFLVTEWSIEGIELPERTFNNIKIYHEISEIKNSWKNFYRILKYYFDPKHTNNQVHSLNFLRIIDYSYNSAEDIKKQDGKKRLEQWMQMVKPQMNDMKKTVLNNFAFKAIAGSYGATGVYPSNGGTEIDIYGVTIDLFFNELNFQVINSKTVYYYFKK